MRRLSTRRALVPVLVAILTGILAVPADAAPVCEVRKHKHLVRCTNISTDTYQMRVRVRLDNGKRPSFKFILDPGETWKRDFNAQIVGVGVERTLLGPPPVPGVQQFNDGRIAVYTNSYFNGANDQTDFYFVNQTASSISYSCTWMNVSPTGSTYPGNFSDPSLPGYDYDVLGGGGVSSSTTMVCTSALI
jgi:hypothetical protein